MRKTTATAIVCCFARSNHALVSISQKPQVSRNFLVLKSGRLSKGPLHALSTDEDIALSRTASTPNVPKTRNYTIPLTSSELAAYATASLDEDILKFQDPNPSNFPPWIESAAWRSVIIILCALWASNFAAAKLVMSEPGVDSSLYALSRFGVAAGALAPFAIGSLKRATVDWDTLKQALVCGTWVAFGYLGQTLGLMTTTASKSCVICSMHCVFVAAIAEYWRVQKASETTSENTKFDLKRLIPAAIAVIGVAIVELHGAGGAPTIGDALSFAQPVGFGMGYLILEDLMAKKPEAALSVSAIKLAVVAFASFCMFELSPLIHGTNDITFTIPNFSPILSSPMALGGILYTGLVTTALALWVESIAFAQVPATDASLILTTEPLFAAGFGALLLGETFGASDYVGASLIVGACALSIFLDDPHVSNNDSSENASIHPPVDP